MLCPPLPRWKANIFFASCDNHGAHICDVELILLIVLNAPAGKFSAVVLGTWLLSSFGTSNDKALDAV